MQEVLTPLKILAAVVAAGLLLAGPACKKDPPAEEAPAPEPAEEPAAVEPQAEPGAPTARSRAPVKPSTAGQALPADRLGALKHAPAQSGGPGPAASADGVAVAGDTSMGDAGPAHANVAQPVAAGPAAATASQPASQPAAPPPVQPPRPPAPRSPLPDLRLLLTANDVTSISGGKTAFRKAALPGMTTTEDQDSLYYEPEKGTKYGFAIQVFRGATPEATRERYSSMLASYPSAVEIAPIAGKTFFAWWDEVLFVAFIQPTKNLVVVLSCGRSYCDSDKLYELAKKVSTRSG